jgi:hypothetical protein
MLLLAAGALAGGGRAGARADASTPVLVIAGPQTPAHYMYLWRTLDGHFRKFTDEFGVVVNGLNITMTMCHTAEQLQNGGPNLRPAAETMWRALKASAKVPMTSLDDVLRPRLHLMAQTMGDLSADFANHWRVGSPWRPAFASAINQVHLGISQWYNVVDQVEDGLNAFDARNCDTAEEHFTASTTLVKQAAMHPTVAGLTELKAIGAHV